MNAEGRPKPPPDFEESPELTDEDFGRARRMRHGRLADAAPYAAARLRDLLAELDAAEASDAPDLADARTHIRAALAALEPAPAE